MLAQNFKTPADLDLSDAEFDALVKVLGMLERGELRHVITSEPASRVKKIKNGFSMNHWGDHPQPCGTVCCIGGWAEQISRGVNFNERSDVDNGTPLGRLFYPYASNGDSLFEEWDDITPEQAAMALRNFLTTGHPRWEEVIDVDA